MKVMLTGGGTLGPVTPLLAVAEAWKAKDPSVKFVWVGTRSGPERALVEEAGIPFLHIPIARVPRYISFEWVTLPLAMGGAFLMSWLILGRERPNLIVSAGGYTGVPLLFGGWIRRIPSWIHQQDARVTLANRVTIWMATCVTVAWEFLLHAFPPNKTDWVGNPVRSLTLRGARDRAYELFSLDLSRPTVLVVGGGGGSQWINTMMESVGEWLVTTANVIHVTGRGKRSDRLVNLGTRYVAREQLTAEEMAHAYAAATVVVGRAGMATITELSALKKASVIIPLPFSAQVDNALILRDEEAAIVLDQLTTTTGDIHGAIQKLLENPALRETLGERIARILPTHVAGTLVDHLIEHCQLQKK